MAEMIEVACPTCGNVNSVDPSAGGQVACGVCRSRFAVPRSAPSAPGLRTTADGRRPSDGPDLPAPALRRAPAPRTDERELGPAEADLPAPKRATALASLDLEELMGSPADAPEVPQGLEARRDSGADLLAPKRGAPARPMPDPFSMDDRAIDLPAPVRAPSGAAFVPPARGASAPSPDAVDLPAPRLRPGAAALDNRAAAAAARGPAGVVDLPAPRGPAGVVDLPTPRGPAGVVDLPTPRGPAGVVDLPTPRGPAGVVDLPTPRGPAGVVDLPTPRGPAGVVDLPTPRGPAGVVDLPTPRGPAGVVDLPTPRGPAGVVDLPTPRGSAPPRPAGPPPVPAAAKAGSTGDLPTPRHGGPDLPVPKGFFDDLPQPSITPPGSELAPKGFFDDLPRPSDAPTNIPAPKGFFDDAPGRPSAASDAVRAKTPSAPGSLFDDIPVPAGPAPLELGAPPVARPPLDFGAASAIDLGLPPPTRPSAAVLPQILAPSVPPTPPLSTAPSVPPPAPLNIPSVGLDTEPADVAMIVDSSRPPPPTAARPSAAPGTAASPAQVAHDRQRRRILLLVALAVAVLAAGGVFAYRRWSAAKERAEQLATNLAAARRELVSPKPGHWVRAVGAAKAALAIDGGNAEALGLAAEANFASAIDEGIAGPSRIRAGKQILARAATESLASPPIQRARALAALAGGKHEQAQSLLAEIAARPTEGQSANVLLYVGWAKLAAGAPDAVAALDRALAAGGAHKLSGLYARGQAKLAAGDLEGARADFAAVLELDGQHLGAQVALAAALPSAQARQRESDALAILQRKDLAQCDPRAVAHAWLLAADEARRGGRFEVAAERYRKGLEVLPDDLPLALGVAQVELANGRLETAREAVDKVLAVAATSVAAILVAAELDLAQHKLDEARARLDEVAAAKPTRPLHVAQLALLLGRLLESGGDAAGALAKYREAIEAAGERDLAPTMTAVALLTRLADTAADPAAATAHRSEIEALLQPLTVRATDDSAVAVTLGAAYLAASNPTKAEEWLAKAVTQRPDDLDARFQLAKANRKLGRLQTAMELLEKAFAEAPTRHDLGTELASTYEEGGRAKDAAALYEKLLAMPGVTVGLRAHAGRFMARLGEIEAAAKQGEAILRQVPDGDAAGFFLRGLGALHANHLDDARRDLARAVSLDRDPEYLDALGKACEALGESSGDSRFKEEALRAYADAVKLRPIVSSLLGMGRLHLQRRETAKALEALLAANEQDPRNREVLYLVGFSYQELRQFKAATTWYVRANELENQAETDYRLGLAYVELESASAAASSLTRATTSALAAERRGEPKVPWLTEALYQLGRIESDRRNDGAARRAWETYLARSPASSPQAEEVRRALLGLRGQ